MPSLLLNKLLNAKTLDKIYQIIIKEIDAGRGRFMADGSSRSVYYLSGLGPTVVIKVAKKSEYTTNSIGKGIAQNKEEFRVYDSCAREQADLFTKIVLYHPQWFFLIVEKATLMKMDEDMSPFGMDWDLMQQVLEYSQNLIDYKPDEDDRYSIGLTKHAYDYLKDNKRFQMLLKAIENCDMYIYDIVAPIQWGYVNRNGKKEAVLIDYGASKETMKLYESKELLEQLIKEIWESDSIQEVYENAAGWLSPDGKFYPAKHFNHIGAIKNIKFSSPEEKQAIKEVIKMATFDMMSVYKKMFEFGFVRIAAYSQHDKTEMYFEGTPEALYNVQYYIKKFEEETGAGAILLKRKS